MPSLKRCMNSHLVQLDVLPMRGISNKVRFLAIRFSDSSDFKVKMGINFLPKPSLASNLRRSPPIRDAEAEVGKESL